jgi:hypothetical protein
MSLAGKWSCLRRLTPLDARHDPTTFFMTPCGRIDQSFPQAG